MRKRKWIWGDKNIAPCVRGAYSSRKSNIYSDINSHNYVSISEVREAGADTVRVRPVGGSQNIL